MLNRTIVHLTGMRSTKYGGLERYLLELTRLCNRKGYHTVLQYESRPQSIEYLRKLEESEAELMIFTTSGNLSRCIWRLASLAFSTRPEILHLHFVTRSVLLAAAAIARLLGTRKIVSMVHSHHHLRENSPSRFAFNCCDHVLGVSNAVAGNLLCAGVKPEIVSTHYLGLFGQRESSSRLRNRFRSEFSIPERAAVIACIAFDHPVKGLDVLLEAFGRIVGSCSEVHLIVVGVNPDRSALPEQARRLELSAQVHWAGIRDGGWRVLNAADVYVQPSRSEGLPLTIMEAMSLKLPVVATSVSGVPEAVIDGETGYLVDPDDVGSLAVAIKRILAESSKWRVMGEAGYQRYIRLFKGEESVRALVEKYYGL
jgi:glycosyltransferase involved in cell wall biosynthesis